MFSLIYIYIYVYICTHIYLCNQLNSVLFFHEGLFLDHSVGTLEGWVVYQIALIKDQQKITKHIGQVGQVLGD